VRLVQVSVPTGKRETVTAALDDEDVDYVVTEEVSDRGYDVVISFPLPTPAVEPVLERLREAGIERDAYTVVVGAETVVSKRFESLAERYEDGENAERIAREELRSRANDLATGPNTFFGLTVVSVVIATAGLLLDSPAVVVGSMVIAPLIGPAMAFAVGTVIDDEDLFVRGLRFQVAGFVVAIAAATAFAVLVRTVHLVPPGTDVLAIGQVAQRVSPDVLSLAVALGAGIAGAYSMQADVSASLVGVMIAVALVPPTAVVGIGIAWGLPGVVVGAGVLVLVNTLSVDLAALATFWYSGYRPERWFRLDEARATTLTRLAVLAAGILVLSIFLGGATVVSVQEGATEEAVATEVTTALTMEDATELVELRVTFAGRTLDRPLTPDVDRVVVTVTRPPGDDPGDLPGRLAEAVARADPSGGAVVELRVIAVHRARLNTSVDDP
jgi:uncharacterized hydrophobic protein (TIGR00341 family)